MLQWEQSNRNEASDVYIFLCCSYVYAFNTLCLTADKKYIEIHLDRLDHFGYSVACVLVCCLTLSWKIPKWGCNLRLDRESISDRIGSGSIYALRRAHAELSVRKNLVSDMVWDLCLQRQTRTQEEEPLHPTHRRIVRCALQAKTQTLRVFGAIVRCSIWFGEGPTRNQTSWGDVLADFTKTQCWLELLLRKCEPKRSAVIPMFPLSCAWWPYEEWTCVEKIATDNWVKVLWSISPACRKPQMRHRAFGLCPL